MPDDIIQARLEALAANFVQTAAAQKDWSLSADVIADYEQRAADLRALLSALRALEAMLRKLVVTSTAFQNAVEDVRTEFDPNAFMEWDDAIDAASSLLAEGSPAPINETAAGAGK